MFRHSRQTRRWWSGGLIAALLFLQLATAAYACPLVARAAMPADMPCAEMMARGLMNDEAHPGLCAEHCKAGAMNVDAGHAPVVQAFAPAAVLAVLPEPTAQVLPATWAAHDRQRRRAPPPTHTVLHCCYRV